MPNIITRAVAGTTTVVTESQQGLPGADGSDVDASSVVKGRAVLPTGAKGTAASWQPTARHGEISIADPLFDIDLTGANDSTEQVQNFLNYMRDYNLAGIGPAANAQIKCSAPVYADEAITLHGMSMRQLRFRTAHAGHLFRFGGRVTTTTTHRTTALLTGGTYAWKLDGDAVNLGLGYLGQTRIQGWSAIHLAFPYKHGSTVSGVAKNIGGWCGQESRSSSDGFAYPCHLRVHGFGTDNNLQLQFETTADTYALTHGTQLVVGNTYYIAVDYDGSTLRLFVNGTLSASIAATGTIVQPPYTWLHFGGTTADFPAGGGYFADPVTDSVVDGIEVWNASQHTSNYSPPTAKRAYGSSNANLKLSCQFFDADWYPDQLHCKVYDNTVDGYLPFFRMTDAFGQKFRYDIRNVSVEPLSFLVAPIYAMFNVSCPQSRFAKIYTYGGGIAFAFGDDYQSEYHDVTAYAGTNAMYGFVTCQSAYQNLLHGADFANHDVGVVLAGSQCRLEKVYCLANAWRSIMLSAGDYSLVDISVSTEGGGASQRAQVLVDSAVCRIHGGPIDTAGSMPGVEVKGNSICEMIVPDLYAPSASALVRGVASPGGDKPRIIITGYRNSGDITLTDTPEFVSARNADYASQGGGTQKWTGKNAEVTTEGNAFVAYAKTTSATPEQMVFDDSTDNVSLSDGATTLAETTVVAHGDDWSAVFKLARAFRRSGGSVTAATGSGTRDTTLDVGTVPGSPAAAFVVDGTGVGVEVTGVASETVYWGAFPITQKVVAS